MFCLWYYCFIMRENEFDLEYLCSKMSDMSGLPLRIYAGRDLEAVFSVAPMPADPAARYLDQFLDRTGHVSFFTAEDRSYYGVLRSGDVSVIIGPSKTVPYTTQEIKDLAFELGVGSRDMDAFLLFIRSIVPMPLGSILQMMCTLNYILNGEKLGLSDFGDTDADLSVSYYSAEDGSESDIYKSVNIDRQISELIRSGDTDAVSEWLRSAPSVRTSSPGGDQLRHEKNDFILTASLSARAAAEGGLDAGEAYKLRDTYIQRCENSRDTAELMGLQYEMVLEFTSRVGSQKDQTDGSLLTREVYRYITSHISEPIRTEDIAASLFRSRSRLSTAFREQTGLTLVEYIHRVKTERAKQLLLDPSKSAALIGEYLGYSSASHFSRIFRKYAGMTPADYRRSAAAEETAFRRT